MSVQIILKKLRLQPLGVIDKLSKYKITTDIFFIPNDDDKLILYAPLKGFVCVANDDMVPMLC